MLSIDIAYTTECCAFHTIKSQTLFLTILTIDEYHSSSSTLFEYSHPEDVLKLGNEFSGLKATYVHFPSRFTRQYNFAMLHGVYNCL